MLILQHPYQCNPKVSPVKVIKNAAVAKNATLGNNTSVGKMFQIASQILFF
jgi:hypothetical protein